MHHRIPILGILGGLGFMCSGIPPAWKTFKAKKSIGMPVSMIWTLLFSFVCMYSYLLLANGFDLIVFADYGGGALAWSIIAYYHYRGKLQ